MPVRAQLLFRVMVRTYASQMLQKFLKYLWSAFTVCCSGMSLLAFIPKLRSKSKDKETKG